MSSGYDALSIPDETKGTRHAALFLSNIPDDLNEKSLKDYLSKTCGLRRPYNVKMGWSKRTHRQWAVLKFNNVAEMRYFYRQAHGLHDDGGPFFSTMATERVCRILSPFVAASCMHH